MNIAGESVTARREVRPSMVSLCSQLNVLHDIKSFISKCYFIEEKKRTIPYNQQSKLFQQQSNQSLEFEEVVTAPTISTFKIKLDTFWESNRQEDNREDR